MKPPTKAHIYMEEGLPAPPFYFGAFAEAVQEKGYWFRSNPSHDAWLRSIKDWTNFTRYLRSIGKDPDEYWVNGQVLAYDNDRIQWANHLAIIYHEEYIAWRAKEALGI